MRLDVWDRLSVPWHLARHLLQGHGTLRFLLAQTFSLFLCELLWFENHTKLLQRSRKSIGHLVRVILDHRRSCVFANIEGLVEREAHCDCRRHLALGHLISIYEHRAGCPLSNAASLVVEAETDHV